ncbi:MAG: hypothetical protein HPY59_18500 [Anaerolineae bacterium]|nr:hypothetical protein [Anaerolineae bacterium]
MSYQEKKTIVSIVSGALLLVAYCIYAFGRYNSGAIAQGDLKHWAGIMLIFIGIGIVLTIVIQIVFHILLSISIAIKKKIQDESLDDKEIEKSIQSEMVEDEMDRLINLKSTQIGFIFAGIGFVTALVSLVLGYSPVVMLNILFISFSAGSVLEGFTHLYFYRRGIQHG